MSGPLEYDGGRATRHIVPTDVTDDVGIFDPSHDDDDDDEGRAA